MYLLALIAAIIAIPVVGAIYTQVQEDRKHGGWPDLGVIFATVAAGAFATCMLATLVSMFLQVPSVVEQKFAVDLAVIETIEKTEPIFALGPTNDDYSSYFQVYVKNADGSVTPFKISADNRLEIIEDKSLTDVGIWRQHVSTPDKTWRLYNWTLAVPTEFIHLNELRVPPGSVRLK